MAAACALVPLIVAGSAASSAAGTLLPHFQESVAFSGLLQPTAVRFARDGRVFVAEKRGVIKVFQSLSATSPTVFADLRTNVYNYWDRGLLGLELHPDFPTIPYVYVLYTLDAAIGGTPPRWGSPDADWDQCPTPPGPLQDGCVTAGRLSRLEAIGDVMNGQEVVLLEDWCGQSPFHTVGALAFGADGALYVSAGDGSFTSSDYGQYGTPLNPCGDPPAGVGGVESSPTAEGGALRSQDLQTPGDPTGFDGTILRIDPITGAAPPDNPLYGGTVPDDDRVVAYGFRNPFRFAPRPGTSPPELWIGDVGEGVSEEIDRIRDPTRPVQNFGWPCYEGPAPQPTQQALGLNLCTNLYNTPGAVTAPYFSYGRLEPIVPGEACSTDHGAAIAGIAFYGGGTYPAAFRGTLFFADYARECIWAMFPGPSGDPDPSTRTTFDAGAPSPVDLQIGPGGDLFYVGFADGTIRRIQYFPGNQPPVANIQADVTSGPAPLTVHFDGSGSSDPDGDRLTFAWDLDGDGEYDDSTAVAASYTYTRPGNYSVGLRVTDPASATGVATVTIAADNTPPTATIAAPASSLTWKVGDVIEFQGLATDPQDGDLPPSALSWLLILHHCPSGCHEHVVQGWSGVASGSFAAPDHEYPSHLELRLTATDSGGLTDTRSVLLYPATVPLTFDSSPAGAELAVGSGAETAPFTRTVIVGSADTVAAASPQSMAGTLYKFRSWSDGGAQVHTIVAPETAATYTALFGPACGDGVLDPGEACDDGNALAGDGCSPACECENTCGDGVVTPVCEDCDLGILNGQPGSGCGPDCRLRGRCSGSGAECATAADCPAGEGCCGNRVVEGDEECDDGNTQELDCCSSRCKVEPAGSPGKCDDGATPCASAADCGGGLCHQYCEPQTCRAYGPHFSTARVRKTVAGGLGGRWTTAGDYRLNAGRAAAPDAEEVEVTLSEGGQVLFDTGLPAGSFTRPGTDTCRKRWGLSDPVMAAARGWSRGKFSQARDATAGCAPALRFKLAGNVLTTMPAATRLRQTLRIGDDCATAIVACTARGENRGLVCKPAPP